MHRPAALLACVVGCVTACVACDSSKRKAPPTAGRLPPKGAAVTFVAKDAEAPTLTSAVARAESAGPTYIYSPKSEVTPVAPAPPPVRQGAPAEALTELTLSLTPEAQQFVPRLSSLPFYDLDVKIDPESGELSAHVSLDYPNTTGAALSELPLRPFANAGAAHESVSDVHADGRTATLAKGSDVTIANVQLTPPLPAKAWLHLTYTVTAHVPPSQVAAQGVLAAQLMSAQARAPDYGLFARVTGGIALADWLPMVAARDRGRFDLGLPSPMGDTAFADMANFRADVELPTEYRLVAPGKVISEEPGEGRVTHTRLTLAAGRDLALFANKYYREADGREGSTQVRVVYMNSHAQCGQQVLSAARRAVAGMSEQVSPYPWSQFTAVEVPLGGGAGGAEFTGIVAISGMFFTPKSDVGMGIPLEGPFLDELREFTVTHEVVHQWWAIQVGSNPRSEPDVDEPLTQATAALLLAPSNGHRDQKALVDREVAMNFQAMRMLSGEDGPAARPTSEFENTATYAGLVYGKAPLFYEKLWNEVGEAQFWQGLSTYAQTYRFKTAHRKDLLRTFSDAGMLSGARLKAMFSRWFEEAHGDEDLAGRGDPFGSIGKLLAGGGEGGEQGGQSLDFEKLFKNAQDALGQAAAGQAAPQGEQPLVDPKQAAQMLKQLQDTMGGMEP